MQGKKFAHPRLRVHPLTPLAWGAVLVFDDTGVAALSLLASLAHELGHLLLMKGMGRRVRSLTVLPFGLLIKGEGGDGGSYLADAALALGGILANLLCALVGGLLWARGCGERMATWMLANLVLAALNALPHPALDGGDALRALLLTRLSPERCDGICRLMGDLCFLPFFVFCTAALFYRAGNVTLYLVCFFLLFSLASGGGREA